MKKKAYFVYFVYFCGDANSAIIFPGILCRQSYCKYCLVFFIILVFMSCWCSGEVCVIDMAESGGDDAANAALEAIVDLECYPIERFLGFLKDNVDRLSSSSYRGLESTSAGLSAYGMDGKDDGLGFRQNFVSEGYHHIICKDNYDKCMKYAEKSDKGFLKRHVNNWNVNELAKKINCVSCNYKCSCPKHHYLSFLTRGMCLPTADYAEKEGASTRKEMTDFDDAGLGKYDAYVGWANGINLDFCGRWGECGYECMQCPEQTYNFDDLFCEGVTCCKPRDEVDPRYHADIDHLQEGATLEQERKEDEDEAMASWNAARERSKGVETVEAWSVNEEENYHRAKYLEEFWFPLRRSNTGICGAEKANPQICREFYSIEPCYMSTHSGMVTVAYMPHNIHELSDGVENFLSYYGIHATNRRYACAECATHNGQIYLPHQFCHHTRFFQPRERCICANCAQIEDLKNVLQINNKTLDYSIDGKKITYASECSGFEGQDYASLKQTPFEESFLQGASHLPLVISADLWSGGAASKEIEKTVTDARARRGRCLWFLKDNPDKNPKTIPCGQTHYGVMTKCPSIESYNMAEDDRFDIPVKECKRFETKMTRDEVAAMYYGSSVLGADVFGVDGGDGANAFPKSLLNTCVSNRGTYNENLCTIRGKCLNLGQIFAIMQGEGLKIDPLHDFLNTKFASDAFVRGRFQLFVPSLPPGSILYTYSTGDCSGVFYDYMEVATMQTVLIGENNDIGDIDGESGKIEDFIQREWQKIYTEYDHVYGENGKSTKYGTYSRPTLNALRRIFGEGGINIKTKYSDASPLTSSQVFGEKAFKLFVPTNWGCECTGFDVFDDTMSVDEMKIFEQSGLHKCKSCNPRKDILVADGDIMCGTHKKKCQECDYGEFPNRERTACIRCDGFMIPEYNDATGQWNCIQCDVSEYYKNAGAGEEFPSCEKIPVMTLEFTLDDIIISGFEQGDYYVPDRLARLDVISPVRPGYYLDVEQNYTIKQCSEVPTTNTYRVGCGVYNQVILYDVSVGYKRALNMDALSALNSGLDENQKRPVANLQNARIIRGGYLNACVGCGNNEYLSTKCQSSTNGGNGFAGICASCRTCDELTCDNKWLSHELESGCENVEGVATATTDYVLESCHPFVNINSKYYIALGCGNQQGNIWKFEDRTNSPNLCINADEITLNLNLEGCNVPWVYDDEILKLGAGVSVDSDSAVTDGFMQKFEFSDFSTSPPTEKKIKVIGRDESGNYVNFEIDTPERDYKRKHSILYPYCPPGHYVVVDAWEQAHTHVRASDNLRVTVEGQTLADWDSSVCKLCLQDCNLANDDDALIPRTKSSNNEICDGATAEDTQDRCQVGCDVNFYRDEASEKCQQCEMCDNPILHFLG